MADVVPKPLRLLGAAGLSLLWIGAAILAGFALYQSFIVFTTTEEGIRLMWEHQGMMGLTSAASIGGIVSIASSVAGFQWNDKQSLQGWRWLKAIGIIVVLLYVHLFVLVYLAQYVDLAQAAGRLTERPRPTPVVVRKVEGLDGGLGGWKDGLGEL
eukprot:TRINITY_DN13458_c0_g1_i1.p2 TRINITY_DN13458_c0_g1~~TRINITY_DN13458_c0_g1_i1.p2  ORF type:complete len:156 (+),score=42.97 TRINITY_DN13458_c0_g1_i1:109-576(+)